jgi:beta-phosphoglucomutase
MNSNTFILSDLDGTLIDTDYIHYSAYKYVLQKYNISINFNEFIDIINNSNIDSFILSSGINPNILIQIKQEKNKKMLTYNDIKFMNGAEGLIQYCKKNNINIVVVTNTSLEIVNHFKQCLPSLNLINNWVCKEDYKNPKPSPECYIKAYELYYKNEDNIIALENTLNGLTSLKSFFDKLNINNEIYQIYNNYNVFTFCNSINIIDNLLSIY